MTEDPLGSRFGTRPAQDDIEAMQWRDAVAQRLFGRSTQPVTVGRFKVLGRVGSGGAGVVYSAWDPKLERRVAVKVLHAEHDHAVVEREAKLLAKLSDPHVVAVYDVGECAGSPFLAMEFVEGGTVAQVLEPRSPWRTALRIFEQAARGLQAAHDVGMVHGDVKPSNILVGDDGRVRVGDFGIAHVGNEPSSLGATPAYMAPEQAAGHGPTAASDQFSLCVAVFEALFGERPFVGNTAQEVRDNLLAGHRNQPTETSSVPPWLRASLDKGLALDPAQRHASLNALISTWQRGASRSRRILLRSGFAASLLAGVLVTTLGNDLRPVASACQQTQQRIANLWSPEAKQQLHQRFERHDLDYAADAWSRVSTTLDEHANALHEAAEQACRPTDKETSLRQRLCVERRVTELGALIDVLDSDEPSVLEQSVQSLSMLTNPRPCNTLAAPRAPRAEPGDRDALHAQIAQARALRGVGKPDQAMALLNDALGRSRDRQDDRMTALALLEIGDHLSATVGITSDSATAATIEAAYFAANAAEDEQLAASALLALANAHFRSARFDDAKRWLQRLDTHNASVDDDQLRSRAATLRALVDSVGFNAPSTAATTEALSALRRSGVRDSWLAQGLNNLGELQFDRGEYAAAQAHYEQALAIWNEVVGPSHPNTAGGHGNLAETELLRGNTLAARQHFARAAEIRAAAWGADSYWVMHTIAHQADVERRLGNHAQAKAWYAQVVEFADHKRPLRGPENFFELDSGSDQLEPWALNGLALIALDEGDPAAALRYAQAVNPSTQIRPGRHPDLACRFDVLALALAANGEAIAALEVLDRFEDPVRDIYGPHSYKSGYVPLARAQILLERDDGGQDMNRACEALRGALTVFAADPGTPPRDRAHADALTHKCGPSLSR